MQKLHDHAVHQVSNRFQHGGSLGDLLTTELVSLMTYQHEFCFFACSGGGKSQHRPDTLNMPEETHGKTSWTENSGHHSSAPGRRSSRLAAAHSRWSCGARSWSRPAPSGSSGCCRLPLGSDILSAPKQGKIHRRTWDTYLILVDVFLQLGHSNCRLSRCPRGPWVGLEELIHNLGEQRVSCKDWVRVIGDDDAAHALGSRVGVECEVYASVSVPSFKLFLGTRRSPSTTKYHPRRH